MLNEKSFLEELADIKKCASAELNRRTQIGLLNVEINNKIDDVCNELIAHIYVKVEKQIEIFNNINEDDLHIRPFLEKYNEIILKTIKEAKS